jgi:hypothetical protein
MRSATLVCALLALAWVLPLEATLAWGWDETMHVALPAWRMLSAFQGADLARFFEALHACERYPFAYPLLVAFEQGLFGVSEHGARVLGTLVWCATLLVVFAGARRAAPDRGQAAWFTLLLAATCPLALSFAGTTMLEVPAAFSTALALATWLRRRDEPLESEKRPRRDRSAGWWLAVALFTKFNYGLLLWAALALDELVELFLARRRGKARRALASTAALAFWPIAALLWWFVLPLPQGLAAAAAHRAALFDWLLGNQDQVPTSWSIKLLNAATFFAPNPRTFLVLVAGALASLRLVGQPAIRALWLALAVLGAGVLAHRFHLPRFLIPLGPALWILAGVGWARILPRERLLRWPLTAALVGFCAIAPGRDALLLADKLGFFSANPEVRAYQEHEFATQRELWGSRRLRSLGLAAEESRRFFEVLASHVGAEERVAWLDLTEEVSPAGLQYGLARHDRSRRVFAAQLWDDNYVSIAGVDPQWSDARLVEWAAPYDVVLFSEPHHLRGRRGREFFDGYVARLEAQGWRRREIGVLAVERPLQPPLDVKLFTLRRGP